MNQNAEPSVVNDAVRGNFIPRVWRLITPYWRSEERTKAWLLLIAVVALSLVSVGISVWINHWYKDFYNALENKDAKAFWSLIGYFGIIAAAGIVGAVYRLYLTQMLTIRWRRWLTEQHFAAGWRTRTTTSWSRAVIPTTLTSASVKISIRSPTARSPWAWG